MVFVAFRAWDRRVFFLWIGGGSFKSGLSKRRAPEHRRRLRALGFGSSVGVFLGFLPVAFLNHDSKS